MSFVVYDILFLVLFTLATVLFLYKRRSNLQRQGLLYLYRTRVGLRIIKIISKRYAKILRPMQYLIIACGYTLMATMIWFLIRFTYVYTKSNLLVQQTKIPPLVPLIPYLPSIFKVDWLPPFYFTYWIIVIAIIAVSHEFAHGIFARLNNIKVKSTGFGFLGPFLAAFVEPDEKQMSKSSKFAQLSILAAGTFANIIMTILFSIILWLFFAAMFVPAGANFNTYPTALINVSNVDSIGGVPINSLDMDKLNSSLVEIKIQNFTFLAPGTNIKETFDKDSPLMIVYEDAPAVRNALHGPILAIGGVPVRNSDELRNAILSHKPGDVVNIKILEDGMEKDVPIKLGERQGQAYLGVGISTPNQKGITGLIYKFISTIRDPTVFYVPVHGEDFTWFIFNLLWWIIIINLSVALVNMLPVGIFDGGRFFYLTVLGITGKDKIAKKAFSIATWLILAVAVWLMVRWAIAFI